MLKMDIRKIATCCILVLFMAGCAIFRYSIIPQDKKGPNGGALAFIDQRVPDYVEFVVVPGEKDCFNRDRHLLLLTTQPRYDILNLCLALQE